MKSIIFLRGMILLAVLLSGCTSMQGLVKANEPVDKNKGVLLASVTGDDNGSVLDSWYFYKKKGEEKYSRLDALGVAEFGFLRQDDYPNSKSRNGRLLAISLEAGDYELIGWKLYISQAGGYAYISAKTPPPPIAFTISSGSITYLGNLHIDTLTGKNFLGFTIPVGANPNISDNQKEDMELLKVKYPNLSDWPVEINVVKGNPWRFQE